MIAGALQAAFGTTVVEYGSGLDPGVPAVTAIAQAMNAAVVGATNEAIKQLADTHPGRDVRLHGVTVAQHVGPPSAGSPVTVQGAVTATCVLLYEVRPILLEESR